MRSRPKPAIKLSVPAIPEKLFTQVIMAARPQILKLWEEGDKYLGKGSLNCPGEIVPSDSVGKSYYQCQPHMWQCFWQGGSSHYPSFEVDLFGQTYHVVAHASFPAITSYSNFPRYYEMFKRKTPGLDLLYGYKVVLQVREIPGLTQPLILTDTCRDTFLPERVYGQGQVEDRLKDGFIWDNFDRRLFVDKFYVTNQQVNEWRLLTAQTDKLQLDRTKWAHPALLSYKEQKKYCGYFGKRLLEAKIFDAATMAPSDLKNPMPDRVIRPRTPWQRDHSKTFLGMARINPDYQLTPLDCQLAQVKGCQEKYFTTDSATWMGLQFALGFYPESLENFIDPTKNLKMSSRFLDASSKWHELGLLSYWNGKQTPELPVAFRCYEEVVP